MPRYANVDKLMKHAIRLDWSVLKWVNEVDICNAINPNVVERKDLEKITEAHEKIGYEKGFRDGYAQAVEDADRKTKKTNADRIRAMSDEELADWLEPRTCQYGWLDWLRKETEDAEIHN